MRFSFARSAGRHGIDPERAGYVIEHRPAPLREGDAVVRAVRTKDGRTLTEAEIDQLADWVERDVDPGSWKPHPGRPRIDLKATKHTPRIAVRVPENVRRGAKARAASEGRSISAVVRDLLEAYAQGS